jgi:hypothetical protein
VKATNVRMIRLRMWWEKKGRQGLRQCVQHILGRHRRRGVGWRRRHGGGSGGEELRVGIGGGENFAEDGGDVQGVEVTEQIECAGSLARDQRAERGGAEGEEGALVEAAEERGERR